MIIVPADNTVSRNPLEPVRRCCTQIAGLRIASISGQKVVSKTISAQPGASGTWTDEIAIGPPVESYAMLEITTAGSTVTLQYRHGAEATWQTYDTYASTGAYLLYCPVQSFFWRAGVTQANWSAATTVAIKR